MEYSECTVSIVSIVIVLYLGERAMVHDAVK
jgi:hypothetical protein